MNKPELLAPAGNLEKLKMAIIYGADAVYIGAKHFGLRAFADNFTLDEMREAVEFAHSRGKKVYLTLNIIPHNEDLVELPDFLNEIKNVKLDAVIISDPGILEIIKEVTPEMEIHLSTQANTTNWRSANFWYKQGVSRIILARELSLREIKEIREKTPPELNLEVFVHGSMCISYSGRCLLSSYLAHRDANRGECAHPCRWKYYLMEEKRPNEYFQVFEDNRGTYIMNSKDLCMIQYIPELVQTGVSSFKIEGRMKSSYYVATVVKSYRQAIDEYFRDGVNYKFNPLWLEEIMKVSHRSFTTGFYFGKPDEKDYFYESSKYIKEYDFVGLVLEFDDKTNLALVEQRNKMVVGDVIEVFGPEGTYFVQKIEKIWDQDGNEIDAAPHPQQKVYMVLEKPVKPFYMLRKKSI